MKFARTIRFDKSDLNIFPVAAEEGELALVGTFSFNNIQNEDLKGKVKQAFSNGFIGCSSFGYSTLVSLVTVNEDDLLTGAKKTFDDLLDDASAWEIRNTYPTYSKVPPVVQELRKIPFFGNFVSFPSEMLRTGVTSVAMSLRHIASDLLFPQILESIISSNPIA